MTMQSKHIQVPLKQLRFGHEAPHHPGNARVTGRQDGIAELAAHIHARGKIDDLLIYDDGVADVYFVANGNRSLAALRMIYGDDSAEPVDCKLTTAAQAYEDSLAVAVLARKFHPVDEYEGFAKLRDQGKTSEEIARQYGLTEREVDQALALGHLSPQIREIWRKGQIKAEIAKAFTLEPDHAKQDEILAELLKAAEGDYSELEAYDIKDRLKVGGVDCGELVEFVGIDAYVAAGGKVQRDFFGTDHQVSDVKLAKMMAAEKLAAECKRLKEAGWSFALLTDSVRNTRHEYGRLKKADPTDAERAQLAELNQVFHGGDNWAREGVYHTESFGELSGAEQKAYLAYHALARDIELRGYTAAMMAKAGCFVGIDDDGLLEVEYGLVKPAEKKAAAEVEKQEQKAQAKSAETAAIAAGKPAPAAEPKVLSNALTERLSSQLIAATRDAIAGDPLLAESPFAEVMAKTLCAMITPEQPYRMPDGVRTKLPTIRQALDLNVFNAAIAKRFDADDYFGSAPKGFVLKAIGEAINPDEARKIAGKSKAEIAKFALANLQKTGWLPKELRTVHYKGPGSDGFKRPVTAGPAAKLSAEAKGTPAKAVPAKAAPAASKPTMAETVRKAKAARIEKVAAVASKRFVKAQAKKGSKRR